MALFAFRSSPTNYRPIIKNMSASVSDGSVPITQACTHPYQCPNPLCQRVFSSQRGLSMHFYHQNNVKASGLTLSRWASKTVSRSITSPAIRSSLAFEKNSPPGTRRKLSGFDAMNSLSCSDAEVNYFVKLSNMLQGLSSRWLSDQVGLSLFRTQ